MIPSAWRPPLITPSRSHRRNGHVALAPFESAAGASLQVVIAVRISQEAPTENLRIDFRSENVVGLLDEEEVEEAAIGIMICDVTCYVEEHLLEMITCTCRACCDTSIEVDRAKF